MPLNSAVPPQPPEPSHPPVPQHAPPKPRHTGLRAAALPIAVGAAGAAAVALLHFRDPHVEGSYGICPTYGLFGIFCPGCGGMRAVHNLTDGRILDSLHSNLLVIPMLLIFTAWIVDWSVRAWQGMPMRHYSINKWTMWSIFAALAVYAVLRNTPWGTWLTPV